MDAPGSGRASGRVTEVRPSNSATHHQRHHSRSSPDCRSRSGSQHHDRHESVDSMRSGSSYVSRPHGPVVPGRTTTDWEENHQSDPFASQNSTDGRLGRCDRPGRLGSFGRLGRPDGLGRGTGLSRVRVSRGSRFGSGGAGDCVRLSSCCRPGTGSESGRCRLSTPTGLSRWRLGTPTGLSRWRLGTPTGLSRWRLGTPPGLSRWRLGTPTGLSRWRLGTPPGLSRWRLCTPTTGSTGDDSARGDGSVA